MKIAQVCIFTPLVIALSLYGLATPDCNVSGEIKGTVVDSSGNPVRGADVVILSEECAVVGIEPRAESQADGSFDLTHVPRGRVGVYARKLDEGFPDTRFAIYGDPAEVVERVNVEAFKAVEGVIVKLPAKAGRLSGVVIDRDTKRALTAARITISSPASPRIMLSKSVEANGKFNLLIPARPTKLYAQVPGYQLWFYSGEEETDKGIITMKPGE